MEKLISVIVPVYNIENYLGMCIESILNQTYTNLEVLLIDDGSTDTSAIICDTYAQKDTRVRVIHRSNGGLAEARNTGLEVAQGEYIGFVDGDDWIDKHMYEKLLQSLNTTQADIAFGIIQREHRKYYENEPNGEQKELTNKEILDAYIFATWSPHILKSVCDKLYTRKIIGATRFKSGIHGEDGQFNNHIIVKCKKIVFLSFVFYYYRDARPGNISGVGISQRLFTDKIPIMLEQIDILKEAQRYDLSQRQLSVFYEEMLRYYFLIYNSSLEEKENYLEKIKNILIEGKRSALQCYQFAPHKWKYRGKLRLFYFSNRLYCFLMNKKGK